MGDTERDTARTVVQTYVPAYQRDQWDDHAEQLGMSRSEFVRSMVQAGRRGFGAEGPETAATASNESQSLDDQVREALAASAPLSWAELLAAVTGDIESRLETTLQRLQESDELRYSGRQGGYVLEDGESA